MLQTPINVTPSNNQTMDASDYHLHTKFTFQGDLLTFVQKEFVDMEFTGDPSAGTNNYVAYTNYPTDGHLSEIHNGESVSSTDTGWARYFFHDGRNYKFRMRLFQHYPYEMPTTYRQKPLADMYYARGKIYETPEGVTLASNQAVIAPNLTNIKPPYEYQWTTDGVTHVLLLGAIYMDIEHERKMIYDYDPETGVVTFKAPIFKYEALPDDYTALELDIDNGKYSNDSVSSKYREVEKPYKLFTNYIETGWYDFRWRTPQTTSTSIVTSCYNGSIPDHDAPDPKTVDAVEAGMYCTGSYSQAVGVGLKWYQYELYALDIPKYDTTVVYHTGDLVVYDAKIYKCRSQQTGTWTPGGWILQSLSDFETPSTLLEKTDRIYSYDLDASFPMHPYEQGYGVKLITASQDDFITSTDYVEGKWTPETTTTPSNLKINGISYEMDDDTIDITVSSPVIRLTWTDTDEYNFTVYRREVYADGSVNPRPTFLSKVVTQSTTLERNYTVVDYAVGNHQTYRYEIIVKDAKKNNPTSETPYLYYGEPIGIHYIYNVSTNWDGWSIIGLTPQKDDYNRHIMKVGDRWDFISDIDSGDITQNINSALHVGTAAYAKTTRDYTIYESGSFTANLLKLECPSGEIVDDIERVKAWTRFIAQNNPFLLKSEKGDVWVVDIVNNPSRKYDESVNPIFTHISYEWAESIDVEKCVFH